MSLQSLPVKEFCHEINFLLFTQAGGDTDKMLTFKRDCTFYEKTAILWHVRVITNFISTQNHIWIAEYLYFDLYDLYEIPHQTDETIQSILPYVPCKFCRRKTIYPHVNLPLCRKYDRYFMMNFEIWRVQDWLYHNLKVYLIDVLVN